MFVGEVKTAANMMPNALLTGNDNYFNFDISQLAGKMQQLYGITDREEYKNAVSQYIHECYLNPPYVPMYFRTENVIYGSYVSGIEQPTVFDPYNNIEKWFFYKNNREDSGDE
mgnify:FL=1